jgi:tetratricopeptide (TPR) repeat protein
MAKTAEAWARWALVVGLGVGPGGASAQAPEAAPASAAASAAPALQGGPAPDDVPDTPRARAILKRVKQAERAGYERHDLKRYLGLFDAAATVAIGRLSESDGHDRVYDLTRWSTLKALETAEAPHKLDLLYFRSAVLKVDGETARLEIDMRVDFFGGHRVNRVRYDLALKANRAPPKHAAPGQAIGERPEDWKVVAVRFWPLVEELGGEPSRFSVEYWKRKDEEAAKPPEGLDELAVIARLLFAWRFADAEKALVALAAQKPERADVWLALARARLELGEFEAAKEAFAKALERDHTLTVPALLAKSFPKARQH